MSAEKRLSQRQRWPGGPDYMDVEPHAFEPLRRRFNRGRCRFCLTHEDNHPTVYWKPARPLGDKTLPWRAELLLRAEGRVSP